MGDLFPVASSFNFHNTFIIVPINVCLGYISVGIFFFKDLNTSPIKFTDSFGVFWVLTSNLII